MPWAGLGSHAVCLKGHGSPLLADLTRQLNLGCIRKEHVPDPASFRPSHAFTRYVGCSSLLEENLGPFRVYKCIVNSGVWVMWCSVVEYTIYFYLYNYHLSYCYLQDSWVETIKRQVLMPTADTSFNTEENLWGAQGGCRRRYPQAT